MVELPVRGVEQAGSGVTMPGAAQPAAGFAELLASLDRLGAAQQSQPSVDDVDSLRAALAQADEGFRTAMDLRRQLEAAFRGRQA